MSTTEQDTLETEGRESGLLHGEVERAVLVRAFNVQAALADKRTLDVRIVPFDEIGLVADPPDFKQYREQWMPGVFANQERAANRILLRFRHDTIDEEGYRKPGAALSGVVGHGLTLRETAGGAEGSFRLHDTEQAATARNLIEDGALPGVSAEFAPIKSVRTKTGIVQRVRAHLDSVSLAFNPVYTKAQILALREQEVIVDEARAESLALDSTTVDRLRRAGIALPARYTRDEIDEEVDRLLTRAFTMMAWDGSASRWDTAEAYCAASAIDLNPAGEPKTKAMCHLPFKEPGTGDINVNAVRAALSRIGQGDPKDASQAQRDRARAMLERLLAQANRGN